MRSRRGILPGRRRPERIRPRRFAPGALLAGACLAGLLGLAVGLLVTFTPVLGGLEQDTLATRFSIRGPQHPRGVAVVGIDDRSFGLLQTRWPFPRSWHGEILERLRAAGARAVFYDVQFTEPTTPAQDGALFDALGQTGGAILATTETDGHGHTDVLGGDANLAQVGSRAAASTFAVGAGGTVTRIAYAFQGLDTAAVAVAQRVLGRAPLRSLFAGGGAYIDYQGPPGTFPTLSFADVLRGRFPAAAVRGKVVVVGATSPSLQDVHATPAASGQLMSGAEVQANAIWTVLHGVPLRPAPPALAAALAVLLALAVPLVRLRRSAAAVALAGPALVALYLLGAQLAFDGGIVVPVVGPLSGLVAAFVATLATSLVLAGHELKVTQLEIVRRLGRAAEWRDGETARHLERMAFLCERLALAAGVSRHEAKLLRRASALHDVGKIAIPDEVLLKTGGFDAREREIMSTHASIGAEMLSGSSTGLIQIAEAMARTHHERWDGGGYPAGLAGEAIPLAGRICAICDVFDALITRRRYKQSWSLAAALAEIEAGAGSRFDPALTATFLQIAPGLYRTLVDRVDPDIEEPGLADPRAVPSGFAAERDGAAGRHAGAPPAGLTAPS